LEMKASEINKTNIKFPPLPSRCKSKFLTP
jgi:hypothetical protein